MRHIIISLLLVFSTILSAQNPHVILETNQGNIELELFPDVAPLAVENFTTHVKNGYYNNLTFHRIIKNFMIQGGDPTGTGRGGESIWGKEFKNEYAPNVVFDKAGILAMANAGPNTNGSQFFITVSPTSWLNGGYTIFGKVVDKTSMDVVLKMSNVKTNGRYGGDKPIEAQTIKKAYIK
ncbi:peptidylprolyl isomerase [Sulfurimonas sp.]|uniref:peptidylprolyl isomerase n=1 Tax=Sulfurimonas sp. TaxID=2022749 RepID=UPI003D120C60